MNANHNENVLRLKKGVEGIRQKAERENVLLGEKEKQLAQKEDDIKAAGFDPESFQADLLKHFRQVDTQITESVLKAPSDLLIRSKATPYTKADLDELLIPVNFDGSLQEVSNNLSARIQRFNSFVEGINNMIISAKSAKEQQKHRIDEVKAEFEKMGVDPEHAEEAITSKKAEAKELLGAMQSNMPDDEILNHLDPAFKSQFSAVVQAITQDLQSEEVSELAS